MEPVIIKSVEICNENETTLYLRIRGREVKAIFPVETNQQVLTKLRDTLVDICAAEMKS